MVRWQSFTDPALCTDTAIMAEIEVTASQWRFVEVGRVVLFTHGQFTGRLAVIVEIIDHKRVSLPHVFLPKRS